MANRPLLVDASGGVILSEQEYLQACRLDPNLFIEFVMGVRQARLHERMQDFWLGKNDTYTEVPRGHGKTVQVCGNVAWSIGNNPAIRVKYIQQNDDEAAKSVGFIKSIMETPEYRLVFPNVRPGRRWGETAIDTSAQKSKRDYTVEGKGIFGRASGRADLLVADDVCDLANAIIKPGERGKVKEAWSTTWLPMRDFSDGREPRTLRVGTPYHVSDITADWRSYHGADGTLLRMPCINFVSPWEEAYSPARLKMVRNQMGQIAFARSYELIPVSTDQIVFSAEWLDRGLYTEMPVHVRKNGINIGSIDWAFTEKTADATDPDRSVFLCGRRDMIGNCWLRAMRCGRWTFPEFCRRVVAEVARLGVMMVYAEANGANAGLCDQLQTMCPVPVIRVPRSVDKHQRASLVQPFVESGMLHIPSTDGVKPSPEFQLLYDEMTTFPAGDHDDTVDACVDLITACGAPEMSGEEPETVPHNEPFSRIYGRRK